MTLGSKSLSISRGRSSTSLYLHLYLSLYLSLSLSIYIYKHTVFLLKPLPFSNCDVQLLTGRTASGHNHWPVHP
jgi:disulfide bond formation protein DsbB